MARPPPSVRSERSLADVNREFYDALWARSRLVPPERFNTWPLVQSLLASSPSRLEVAPGLRPRLPIQGTTFVDMSEPAVAKLREHGADAVVGVISTLPLPNDTFELVAALDIVEHVDDDDAALSELSRVSTAAATLVLSAPFHPSRWTAFDDLVGHRRRYEPEELVEKLARHGWRVQVSAVYGMQPRSSRLLDYAVWQLQNRRERAIFWYDRVILPLATFFQKGLTLTPGMLDATGVDEALLVCRKSDG
jgi:SAM-dependent methyltransferase